MSTERHDSARPRTRRIGPGDGALDARATAPRCASGTRAPSRRRRRRCASTCRGAELLGGALDDGGARRRRPVLKSPGLAPHDARIAALLAARRRGRRAGAGRARPVRAALDDAARRARLRAQGDRRHRHQRQDDDDGADRAAGRAQRQARRGRRQHRADDAADAGRRDRRRPGRDAARAPARGLGARALELPARRRRSGFEADAAALLNLTQDHLDWHGSMAAYARAKARIFGTRAIDRRQPRRCGGRGSSCRRRRRCRRRRAAPPKVVAAPRRRASAPARPSGPATGAWSSRTTWPGWCVRRATTSGATPRGRGRSLQQPDAGRRAAHPRPPQRRSTRSPRWRWPRAIGCPLAPMLHAPARVPRRAAPGRARRHASTASTPSTTARAPTSAPPSPRSTASAPTARRPSSSSSSAATARARTSRRSPRRWRATRARSLTIGRDAARDRGGDRRRPASPFERRATLEAAVDAGASRRRGRGDAVLLSPACASLDMFRNYAHRAEVFVAAVRAMRRRPTKGASHERRSPACSRPGGALRLAPAPPRRRDRRRRRRAAPRRRRADPGARLDQRRRAASRRACSASTGRSSASSSPCSRSAW